MAESREPRAESRYLPAVTLLLASLLLALGAFLGGLLGSLTGLGGGIVVVPMLTVLFGVDFRLAVAASLVSVIATSSGSAAAFVRDGFTNVRVGILLELGTVVGALGGAAIAAYVPTSALAILFGVVLLYSAARAYMTPEDHSAAGASHPWAERLRLAGSYPTPAGPRAYAVQGVPTGVALMVGAGVLSALLGIGAGVVKVLAMDRAMRLPFKVSTTTSNFMIGVTAAASSGVYLHRGYIEPAIAFPVMLGVLGGALTGARLLARAPVRPLRVLFTAVAVALAAQMLYEGLRGTL